MVYLLRPASCHVLGREVDVIPNDDNRRRSLEIFIDELVADEEFRDSFLRSPRKTLAVADEWGVPLCESEIHALMATDPSVWDHVAEELDSRLQEAA
jgi:hypothetical protein